MSRERYRNGTRVIERWNRAFTALAAEPRRQLVVSLLDAEGTPVELPESAVNPNVPVDADELRLRLRHHHLPVLSDGGFVEWDDEPFRARRGPHFDEVGIVIESIQSAATAVPDELVFGCNRLERERQEKG